MPIERHSARRSRRGGQRGSSIVEFLLCVTFFWLPLFLGALLFGFNLIRATQVTHLCRTAGHMYAFGTDFTQTASQQLLVGLAPSLNMTATGGNGVIILSTITYVDGNLCTAAGLTADTTSCKNLNQNVITRRAVIGFSALHTSQFGTPNPSIIGASGKIGALDYLGNPTAIANNFSSVLNLNPTNNPNAPTSYAYVAEMWATSPDYNFWNQFGPVNIAARSIF